MILSKRFKNLLNHLHFYQFEKEYIRLIKQVELLENTLQDIQENYDCDEISHRYHKKWYGLPVNCRCCKAEYALEQTNSGERNDDT